jgi:hypothetical protein
MPQDELDAATIAHYRRVLDEAAAQIGTTAGQRVAGATAAVFAALDRIDGKQREMRAIVGELAALAPGGAAGASSEQLDALVERARKAMGGRP